MKLETILKMEDSRRKFLLLEKNLLAEAERWINNYPRKLLGWKSAAALFDEETWAF